MFQKLCACLLNVSLARNVKSVENIALSAISEGNKDSAVLNIFNDPEYNRSVITIVGTPESIGTSVKNACRTAYSQIDLAQHEGGHPRLGSVDLIPIHPLTEHTSLESCGLIARDIASDLAREVPGTSFFLFGSADVPRCRGLVQRRKEVKWYSGEWRGSAWDCGDKPGPRYGLTGAGAIPYVMNCNVTIDSPCLTLGRQIAASLRATSPGGLPGVQAMAFPHEGKVEIACNVEAFYWDKNGENGAPEASSPADSCLNSLNSDILEQYKASDDLVCSFGTCYHVASHTVVKRVESMASKSGVTVAGNTIVGFSPEQARDLAQLAISTGQREYWRSRTEVTM